MKPLFGTQQTPQHSNQHHYHPYFELMVKLYYRLKPHLLLTFVDFVHFNAIETPGFVPLMGTKET
jgi:hypothetical protein